MESLEQILNHLILLTDLSVTAPCTTGPDDAKVQRNVRS